MVSASTGRSFLSSSMDTTFPARPASSAVRHPTPGPISSTPQLPSAWEAADIAAGTAGSMRKFCPMDLEKWKPYRPKRARRTSRSQRFMARPPFDQNSKGQYIRKPAGREGGKPPLPL